MGNQDLLRNDTYESPVIHSRISWCGIFASTIDPNQEANPAQGVGTGLSIWIGLSMLVSLFIRAGMTTLESTETKLFIPIAFRKPNDFRPV